MPLFADRTAAGCILAGHLAVWRGGPDPVVLGVARGGVPVAHAVAEGLGLALDVLVVRKLGVPGREELAFGAVAAGGVLVLDDEVRSAAAVTDEDVARIAARERAELVRREQRYRGGRPCVAVRGRAVLLVDDGLATGASIRAAVAALRDARPASITVAAPVGPAQTCAALRAVADDVVCPHTPDPFVAVGAWYDDFRATSDEDVCALVGAPGGCVSAVRGRRSRRTRRRPRQP